MRGARVKTLRRTFRETYGFDPPKVRRFIQTESPKNLWQRFWWWITRYQRKQYQVATPSMWRKWKKLAKESDQG